MANPNVLADVSSILQDGVVIAGAVTVGAAVIVTFLNVFGVHVAQTQLIDVAGAVGAFITLARTTIDGLFSRYTTATVENPTPKA